MKTAICEADLKDAIILREQIEKLSVISEISIYSDPKSIEINGVGDVDVIFMGMEWGPARNGIDLAESLNQRNPSAKIIYVMAAPERYVQQVYLKKNNVAGFLIKPVGQQLLEQIIAVIAEEIRIEDDRYILIHENGKIIRLHESKVDHVESMNHLVEIHAGEQIYRVYQSLGSILDQFSDSMIRCHRSYLVNVNKIQELGRTELTLKNGSKVPVGRMYRESVREHFVDRMQ